MVADAKGRQVEWGVECGSPNMMQRTGWKRSTLKAGDKIVVVLNPLKDGRPNGSLVSIEDGVATAYALNMNQERGRLMVEPGEMVYRGMIVGENSRENDIPVNPCKSKHLTNMRSQGDGKGIQLDAPLKLSLERALEYIGADEYVEATPKNLRLRKKILDENQRKRAAQTRVLKVAAN